MPDRDEAGRWLPGSSGNVRGRPKGLRSLTEDLYRILGEAPTADELQALYDAVDIPLGLQAVIDMAGDRQEALARQIVYRAFIGSWAALEQVGGRIDPIPARTELSGPGGGPIVSAGLQLAGSAPPDAQAVYLGLVRGEEVPDAADPENDPNGSGPDAGKAGS